MTTYYYGLDLPINDESDYAGYWLGEITDNSIAFTAYVHGYSVGDSWRGHVQYEGGYTVNKDGSNLILIEETYY